MVGPIPSWLEVTKPMLVPYRTLSHLDDGEAQAIALALEHRADLLLLDERDGTAAARARGLTVTGTLGVQDRAASLGMVDLPTMFFRLGQASSLRAHVPRFGVFQKCVDRRHVSDGQSFHTVQKAALQEVAAHKCPGRIDNQVAQSDPGLPGHQLFGSKRSVTVHGSQMLGEGFAREVQQVRFEMSYAAS